MENKELEVLLRNSAIQGAQLPQNLDVLKNALQNLHQKNRRLHKLKLCIIPGILLGCLCATAALFFMVEDNNLPGPTNNLGGVWCTFTDSVQGGTSRVWPPVSTSCENLFVKSAPGYGGKGYAIRIKGTAGSNDSAFLGVHTYLSDKSSCPNCKGIDLRKYRGICFKMKGSVDNGRLFLVLPHESGVASPDQRTCMTLSGYNDYQVDITNNVNINWTDVKLIFKKDFHRSVKEQSSPVLKIETVLQDEKLIKWKWYGERDKKIDLWIDEVSLF